jgi:ankyrin repeat protein
MWATLWGHSEVSRFLLKSGALVDQVDGGLIIVCIHFFNHIIGITEGMTSLMLACLNNHLEIMQLLILHNANVVQQNVFQGTVLTIARANANSEIEKLVVDFFKNEDNFDSTISMNPYMLLFQKLLQLTFKFALTNICMVWDSVRAIYNWSEFQANLYWFSFSGSKPLDSCQ